MRFLFCIIEMFPLYPEILQIKIVIKEDHRAKVAGFESGTSVFGTSVFGTSVFGTSVFGTSVFTFYSLITSFYKIYIGIITDCIDSPCTVNLYLIVYIFHIVDKKCHFSLI